MPSVNRLFPSQYLSGEDLEGRTITLLIKAAKEEIVGQGDQAEKKLVVYFKATDKKLVLNKTNAFAIAALHGDDYDYWAGKRISVHPVIVTAFGKTAPAVRVLDHIANPAPAPVAAPAQAAQPRPETQPRPQPPQPQPPAAAPETTPNPFNEPSFHWDDGNEEDGEDIPF